MEIDDYVRLRKAFGAEGKSVCGVFKAENNESLVGLFGVCPVELDGMPAGSRSFQISALSDNAIGFNEIVYCFEGDIEAFNAEQYLAIGLSYYDLRMSVSVTDVTHIFDPQFWLGRLADGNHK